MDKNVWIVDHDKKRLMECARQVNQNGGLRAIAMLSFDAVVQGIERVEEQGEKSIAPSLIILNYAAQEEEKYQTLDILKEHGAFAGVPLFFVVESRSEELDEECYSRGATVVMCQPLGKAALLRMERTVWQYEMTRNYQHKLQSQANEIALGKEIKRLNEQLTSRNQLLQQIFGRYFSDDVVNVILEDPKGADLGGKKETVTVMMTDLRGFTSLSGVLPPEVVTDLLNHYLARMTEIIGEYRGTVIEFIGDAILVVFGAPLPAENSVQDALAAAIHMQNAMEEINQYNREKEYPDIEMGIGIHQGEVFIGNIGSEKMMRYNVIGKAVNLASRIESYSVGGQILVSRSTLEQLPCLVHIKNTMQISAKGVVEPVEVCAISGLQGEYSCKLKEVAKEQWLEPESKIRLEIFRIEGKEVTRDCLQGEWLSSTKKKARIQMELVPELYSNVLLNAYDLRGHLLFHDVYGKITEIEKHLVTVHFTYVTTEYEEFFGIREEHGDGQQR